MDHEDLAKIYRDASLSHEDIVNASIEAFQHYMNTYKYSTCCGNGNIFADDVLYMLGVALDPLQHRFGKGYTEFKVQLEEKLTNNHQLRFRGEG